MTVDLAFYRRQKEAKTILLDPGHPYHDILARELDAWADMDAEAGDAGHDCDELECAAYGEQFAADWYIPADPCPPSGIPRVGWPKVRPS